MFNIKLNGCDMPDYGFELEIKDISMVHVKIVDVEWNCYGEEDLERYKVVVVSKTEGVFTLEYTQFMGQDSYVVADLMDQADIVVMDNSNKIEWHNDMEIRAIQCRLAYPSPVPLSSITDDDLPF